MTSYACIIVKNIVSILCFQAKGWLGMIVGRKLYYDFAGELPFETVYEELVKSIGKHVNIGSFAFIYTL